MAANDFRAPRLFLDHPLSVGAGSDLDRRGAHYLVNVLRLRAGDEILVFNGRDGEWRARLVSSGPKRWRLEFGEQTRSQTPASDLRYLFVPLKQARLDYMIQKAVEMGVGRITPVLSDFGQVRKVNPERLRANAIEAAEQCGLLALPGIDAVEPLGRVLDRWPDDNPDRRLLFCDEAAGETDPLSILSQLAGAQLAVMVGPEGGFSDEERRRLRSASWSTAVPLGPRILRADTAAIAALAIVQAVIGDWRRRAPASGD